MAVGFPAKTNFATGDVLTATNMNDITGTLNLLQSTLYPAGRNKVINGDLFWNQRGTTSTTTSTTFLVDRFKQISTAAAGSVTGSVEQFTPGTAPVAGYEAKQYCRLVTTGQAASTDRAILNYAGVEDVRNFAGQTVIISFWAKAATGTPSVAVEFAQSFGSGGSPSATVTSIGSTKTAITTSWARYSFTVAIPSIAGKTIGTDANTSSLQFNIWVSAGSSFDSRSATLGLQNNTFDLWGFQVEAASTGSTASPFQTASGSIGGELALCQRYYYRITFDQATVRAGVGIVDSTTIAEITIPYPVAMRTRPTALEQSGTATDYSLRSAGANTVCNAVPAFQTATTFQGCSQFFVASGIVAGNAASFRNVNTSAYLGWSAEL